MDVKKVRGWEDLTKNEKYWAEVLNRKAEDQMWSQPSDSPSEVFLTCKKADVSDETKLTSCLITALIHPDREHAFKALCSAYQYSGRVMTSSYALDTARDRVMEWIRASQPWGS